MKNQQDWKSPKVDIKISKTEGKGMFATENIKRGEKVIVWGGYYVNKKDADEYQKQGKLVMQWDDDLYSHEDPGNDDGYFINHSCDPNIWMVDAYTLVAKKDIRQGEELTTDYALWEADENYISKWKCKCASPLCRERVTGKDWRNQDLQERYKDHFSPLINKRIQRTKQSE